MSSGQEVYIRSASKTDPSTRRFPASGVLESRNCSWFIWKVAAPYGERWPGSVNKKCETDTNDGPSFLHMLFQNSFVVHAQFRYLPHRILSNDTDVEITFADNRQETFFRPHYFPRSL